MKRILAAVWVSALMVSNVANAALPPQYQRQRELGAILESSEIVNAFPAGELIEQVRWLSDDTYQVKTAHCTMQVKIVDNPAAPDMPGPRRFLLKHGAAVCVLPK